MKLYDLRFCRELRFMTDKKVLLTDKVCVCVCVAKLVPVGYGIKKLQIGCVVEDDKVSVSLSVYLCC